MNALDVLGYAATLLVIIGYAPQVVHLIKKQCSAGISLRAYAIWLVANMLFLLHAIMIADAVFIVLQVANILLEACILFFANKYKGSICSSHFSKGK